MQDPDYKEPFKNPFTDVEESDWFYAPVLWAVENKVTGGMTETTFGPNANCTRAQVVTFLYAAAGKPEVKANTEPFDDVSEADWFYTPVLWAVENGITGGISATEFGPNQECTRAQVVTFLYAAAGKPLITAGSDFSDVADTDWYAKPVIWAKANNITGGISPTEFGPNNICTRAQVVTFLYKADQIK
ncbi:MAG: S-layer homology domain-containing protein [Oscillospiraceae bacterium]|nr:S-layer homology domain-containing protein [Oscillospiraceae bacterium]